ncbi:anti-sigma-D factor RsdA [Micromonospora purpureochromogenes]|uniref:anti-sigma-D factor RsdA n=1 Tax=Micromonospora purpureochromogenes TaxID=47872 RepID=UPI003330BB49
MTADVPPPTDPVLRDDRLFDALNRGEPPPPDHPADDPVTALLADWRTELVTRSEQVASRMERNQSGEGTGSPAASPSAAPPARRLRPAVTAGPATSARPGRRRRTALVGVALSLLTVGGGLWLGAARAEPGGLFWPVTELVYADRADSLVTERDIGRLLDEARQDLAERRFADARHHLERAAVLLGSLGDDETVVRLRGDIDELRRLLPSPAATAPATPGAEIDTATVPVPSDTDPARSTVPVPVPTDPASSHTPARPTPTAPAKAGWPAKPTGGAPDGRLRTPTGGPPRQLPSVPAPTALPLGGKPHPDGAPVARPGRPVGAPSAPPSAITPWPAGPDRAPVSPSGPGRASRPSGT